MFHYPFLPPLSAAATEPVSDAAKLNNNVPSLFGGNALTGGGNTVMIIWYLVVIIALLAALFFVRKFLLKRVKGIGGGKRMRVSDRIMISQDKQIMMVELSGKMMIIGVTNHAVNQLALLDKDDCAELPEDAVNSFGNILQDKLGTIKRQSATGNDNLPDVKKNDDE